MANRVVLIRVTFLQYFRKLKKLLILLTFPTWRWVLIRHGVAAAVEHKYFLKNVGSVATIIDIGANRGQFALAIRGCLPNADIISFEPLDGPAKIYEDVFVHDSRTVLVIGAIGPVNGTATMHVSASDDSSSLLPIGQLQNAIFPGTEEVRTTTVDVGRLKKFVDVSTMHPPRLLKLDVQGFELEALKGCEDQLDQFAWVYVECSFVELYQKQSLAFEVIQWLGQHDFNLNGVYNVSYDSNNVPIQADFSFVSNKVDVI